MVLFDGVCNFCNSSVNFIIRRDSDGYFKFAALQSEAGSKLLSECRIDPVESDSIVLVEDGKAYLYSTAALKIAQRLDGNWPLAYTLIAVPRPIRDFVYKLFAKYRYTLFGKKDQCMIPSPGIKARFLPEEGGGE